METDDVVTLEELSKILNILSTKSTVSVTEAKIKAMQLEKDINTIKNKYDEIINELIAERAEAIRIAQVYKNEIEKYEISDTDIKHLHNTVSTVLDIIKEMSPETNIAVYQQLKDLISIDVLKAIQLLGFNYKAAIGEPLTKICSEAIINNFSKNKGKGNMKNNHHK
jgi:hypothetical protein